MNTTEIRPRSICSVKRLAKAIKRERGIKHAEALDIAAVQSGYPNYREMLKAKTPVEGGAA